MLVGRGMELAVVDRLLAGARAGASGTLVVRGEAGIGKTALLTEAVRRAGDMQVLRASGTQSEQDLPFAGLSQLLRPLLDLLDRIPAPQAEALRRALAISAGGPPERFAVAAATLSLVCRGAEDRPLLLVVDDLHHLDQPSLDALLFASRRLLTDAVAVLLGTRRDTDVDARLSDLPRLELTGLDERDTEALVADRALTPGLVERLHELTAGNPLAVLEMSGFPDLLQSTSVGVPVPRLIARAFTARLRGLDESTRGALLVAAVAEEVDLASLSRAFAFGGCTLSDLAQAERASLVEVHEDRVSFRHPMLRAAIYQSAEATERRTAHRWIADALDAGDLDQRAWHLSEATLAPDADVADVLTRAGLSARDRGAYGVAAGRLERAAMLTPDEDDRAARLALAGESAWLGGLSERALALLSRAGSGATDRRTRNRAVALRGVVSARCGSLTDARDLLLEAAAADLEDDPDGAVELLAEAVYTCFFLGDSAAMRTAVEMLDRLTLHIRSDRSRLLDDLASGMALIVLGEGDEGVVRVRRAVAAGTSELGGDPRWMPWLLLGPMWLREAGSARSLMTKVVADARERVALGTLPFLLVHEGRDQAATDRWAAGEASFREAASLAAETGQRTDEAFALAGLVWLLARQGREDECRALADEALRLCARSHLNLGLAWAEYALGDLEAGLGNTEAAVERYRGQQVLVARLGITDPDLSPSAELVDCLMSLGETEEAGALSVAFARRAEAKGLPWSRARAHRGLAIAGSDPDRHFATALATHQQTPDAYELARTELAYGAYLRRDRRRTEARPHLRAALSTFDRLSAGPWATRAAAELAATGERVQRRTGEGAQPLTPQEFQIVRLLAEGRTTREAATALFLSPKTVEYHLRHVYIKFGISSRRELTERFTLDPTLRVPGP